MTDCEIIIKPISKTEIINDYKIDYLEVKRYYELQSEDEYDYSLIDDNVYNKCNQNPCVRHEYMFNDFEEDEEYEGFNCLDINDNNNNRNRNKRKRKRSSVKTSQKSSKKKISEKLTDCMKRSTDGLQVKTIVNNVNDSKESISGHKSKVILLNGQNNVINIINNKKINTNSVKNKKKSTKNSSKNSSNIKNNNNNNNNKNNHNNNNSNSNSNSNKKVNSNLSISKPEVVFNSRVGNHCCNRFNNNNNNNNSEANNDLISFMGNSFRAIDLLRKCRNCENECEIDELTLAFHLMITSPNDELPNDLKKGFHFDLDNESEDNDRDEEIVDSIDNQINSDIDLTDIFKVNINDIYQQTIEEDINGGQAQDDYIEDFLRKTTPIILSTQQTSVGLVFDPLIIPSTSGYSLNTNR
jgi:hypothetical protein